MSLRFLPKSHQYRMTEHPGPAHKTTNPELRATGATTLIDGGIPKPNLIYWAGKTVAEYVKENPLEVELFRERHGVNGFDMVKELADQPNKLRDAAGERGTEIHDYAEALLHGKPVDIPAELAPYVDGYLRLIDEWEIVPVLTETSVGNRQHWYVGRLDSIVRIGKLGNCLALLDWKTSRGVYGETGLQTAGYAKAEFYVTDDAPDVEIPLPQVERTMVCHITEDGSFLYDLAKNPAEIDRHFELFIAAAFTAKTKKERDAIITEPLELPNTETHEMSAAA
jgi:hypothetical protein